MKSVVTSCLLWSCILLAEAAAQSPVGLPLRLDLVESSSSTDVPSGFTAMAPDHLFGGSNAYGWNLAATGYDSTVFREEDPDGTILGYATMPPLSDPDDDWEHHVDLWEDGHSLTLGTDSGIHIRRRVFQALVDDDVTTVTVHLLCGRPDTVVYDGSNEIVGLRTNIAHGMQVHDGETSGASDTTGLITTEIYPWIEALDTTGDPPFPDHVGLWTRTVHAKGAFESGPKAGGARNLWFQLDTVDQQDGTALVTFTVDVHEDLLDDEDFPSALPAVGAVEIFEYELPPARLNTSADPPVLQINNDYDWYWPPPQNPMPTADKTAFQNGVTQLNAGNLDGFMGAKTWFNMIHDDETQAAAYLWLAGWLAGDRPLFTNDGLEWQKVNQAINLFEGQPESTRPAWAHEYLARAKQYQRAMRHQRLRGFAAVPVPNTDTAPWLANPFYDPDDLKPYGPNVNALLLNLGIAEALWRDISAQQLQAVVGNAWMEPNPLFCKAGVYLGLNYWGRLTKNVSTSTAIGSEGWFMVKMHFDLWRGFDELGLFTRDGSGDPAGTFGDHDALAVAHHVTLWDKSAQAHHDPSASPPDGLEPDYDENAPLGLIGLWGNEGADEVHGSSQSKWWDPLLQDAVDLYDTTSLPTWSEWARHAGRYQLALIAAHEWWADTGSVAGQFGGGDSDDIEFVLQEIRATLPFRGSFALVESVAQGVGDPILAQFEDSGYFDGDSDPGSAADVEHTAENTSNALWSNLLMTPGDPYYIEYALQSMENMVDPFGTGGLPWTAPVEYDDLQNAPDRHAWPLNDSGVTPVDIEPRRFVSFYLDAEGAVPVGPGDEVREGDLPLCGRAILPAFWVVAYNGNPAASELLREWAEWWWLVAMDDGSMADPSASGYDQAKPVGVLPAMVSFDDESPGLVTYGWDDPSVEYTDPKWWIGSPEWGGSGINGIDYGAFSIQSAQTHSPYIYGMFLSRYLDPASDDPTTTTVDEGLDYLAPIYHVAKLVAERWRIVNEPGETPLFSPTWTGTDANTEGHPAWMADKFLYPSQHVLGQIALALPYFGNIPTSSGSGDFWDARRDDVIEWATETILANPNMAARAAVIEGDKDALQASNDRGFDWIDGFFPFLTTWVEYADRIFISRKSADVNLFYASTGGSLTNPPNYRVTWEPVTDLLLNPGPEDTAPVKAVSMYLGDVSGGSEDPRIRVFLHNLEIDPDTNDSVTTRKVRMRLWNLFEPGDYEFHIVLNDGSDEVPDTHTPDATVTIDRTGGGHVFELPYADGPEGEEWVVELRLDSVASSPATGFADAAVTHRDVEIEYDDVEEELVFTLPVHNVGVLDAENTFGGILAIAVSGDSGGEPDGNWYPLSAGLPSFTETITVGGLTGLDPQVEVFAEKTYDWTFTQDLWVRVTYAVLCDDDHSLENNVVELIEFIDLP